MKTNLLLLATLLAFNLTAISQNNQLKSRPGLSIHSKYMKAFNESKEKSSNRPILDSIVAWEKDTLTKKWIAYSKDFLTHTSANEEFMITMDWDGEKWMNTKKEIYVYNLVGKTASQIIQSWNGTDWEDSMKIVSSYSSSALPVSDSTFYKEGNDWSIDSRSYFEYTNQNFIKLQYYENYVDSKWVRNNQIKKEYNNSNKLLSEVVESIGNVELKPEIKKWYTYDENNNLISATESNYYSYDGKIFDSTIYTFDYNSNNKKIASYKNRWVYDYDSLKLVMNPLDVDNKEKLTYDYNDKNDIMYSNSFSWDGTNWMNEYYRDRYTYNDAHKQTGFYSESSDNQGLNWESTPISLLTYDERLYKYDQMEEFDLDSYVTGNSIYTMFRFNEDIYFRSSSYINVYDFLFEEEDSLGYYYNFEAAGLNSLVNSEMLSIYPNPTSGKFTIASSNSINNIEVVNMVGEVVFQAKSDLGKLNHEIDLSNYPAGVYMVKVSNETQTGTKRIVLN